MNNETGNNINARNNCVLELSGIVKNYKQGKQTLEVLAGIDLAIRRGKLRHWSDKAGRANLHCCKLLACWTNRQRGAFS